ncbi:uncharacterized protein LOC125000996 [Mugil cephalus]|uniref:uncharacterized protein LOC125000996 n=1 Tax=Mugil cephalus TaxID=48193 RepID=UPI001FB57CAC|nr:uncharacterized protein LOC125000996 [Mugil cephalus]
MAERKEKHGIVFKTFGKASGGDKQSDTVVDKNDVPELVPKEEEEQEICNVQNNKDITGEDAQEKDLTQECEGALDLRVFHNEDIKTEDNEKDGALIQEEEDLKEEVAQETTDAQPEEDVQKEDSDSWSDNEDDDTYDKEEEFFIQSLPAPPSFFFVPRNAWTKLRKTQKKDHFKGLQWTNIISAGIRKIHPHCSFAFLGHRVKVRGSKRNAPLFKCSAHCLFSDCPVEADVIVHSETTLKAHVYFRGETAVHSKTELQRRPVRADKQKIIYQCS